MPPASTKKTSINPSNRLHPYQKKDIAPDMTSPTSPTSPRSTAGPWQPEDDAQLIEARKQSLNWADISQQYFPSKTANACRKRHERLVDKSRINEDWESTKLEEMAAAYVELRQQIWEVLAKEIGENWKVVETKCMEKGVKNLTNMGNSVRRRARPSLPMVSEDDPNDDSACFLEEHHHGDPYSSVPPSHSSRRTASNASSIAPTPLLHQVPPPNHQSIYQHFPQHNYQPQHPHQHQHQHHQSIPSIASLLESTRAPNPHSMVTTS